MGGLCGWLDESKVMSEQISILDKMTFNRQEWYRVDKYIKDHIAMKGLVAIDNTNGNQPMHLIYNNIHYVIVCTGELYNAKELRAELKSLGHSFQGEDDIEVFVHSYAEWDIACLNRFNGVFALAIWQEQGKRLILARDRIGVKPLFYHRYGTSIIFASELKVILSHPNVQPMIDEEGIAEIFMIGPGKVNGSGIFQGVNELKPGEYMVITPKSCIRERYWHLKAMPHTESIEETIEHTRSLIIDSINRQSAINKPVSCMLSGGLDSSIITRILSLNNDRLLTFSVDYQDSERYFAKNVYQPDSDNEYIHIMTRLVGAEHHNIVLDDEDLAYSLHQAVNARGFPGMGDIDSSLLMFSKKIREHNMVALSGECADELFGGYPWYMRDDLLYRDTFPWSNSIELRKNVLRKDIINIDLDEYVRAHYNNTVQATDYLPTDSPIDRRIREMFRLNFYWFMQTLLIRSDRMSGHAGLKIRMPFSDYRIVEYAYNMPWHYKALNEKEKGILREAFRDYLPMAIIDRKKSPYPKTFNPRYKNILKDMLRKIISDNNKLVNQLIDVDFVKNLIDEETDLSEPWYGQLMRLPQVYAYIIQIDYFLEDNSVKLC